MYVYHAILMWDSDLVTRMPEQKPSACDASNYCAGTQAEAGCICVDKHCGGSVHAGHVPLGGTVLAPPSRTSVNTHICLAHHHAAEDMITPALHSLPLCDWPRLAEGHLLSLCRRQSGSADDLEFGDCADGALVR
jgi:hypothetical protein